MDKTSLFTQIVQIKRENPLLYVFPNLLDASQNKEEFLPLDMDKYVSTIDLIVAESEKSARAFMKRFSFKDGKTFREIPIELLNEHSDQKQLNHLLSLLAEKKVIGLISDAGLCSLADPGANLIFSARMKNIKIKTFTGPSSLVFGLIYSGFCGQRFTFHGYLPREEKDLVKAIKDLEIDVLKKGYTQLFIEAPYRNDKMLAALIQNLASSTYLCVACDLTLDTEEVAVKTIANWKNDKNLARFLKRPAVFLIGKESK